jgi:hypothetical protein
MLNLAKKEWTGLKPVDYFEIHGLLCRIDEAPAQGQLCVKMSQRSLLQHV